MGAPVPLPFSTQLNALAPSSVITNVKRSSRKVCLSAGRKAGWRLACAFLFTWPVLVAATDLTSAITGIEERYNRPRTMQLVFRQTYTAQGHPPRTESGKLYLQKPRRMRWDYDIPAGKLFLSDGKDVYFYSPAANRVEKMRLKQSGDLRTPLAFLMGKLDLRRDFREFRSRPEGEDLHITALPKSDQAPYTRVEFVVNSSHRIQRLVVAGQDRSLMEFHFSEEKINPPLETGLFGFRMPASAEFVDLTEEAQ